MAVRVLVLTGFGINCERETAFAFERAGARARLVHLNDLIADPSRLDWHHVFAIPGGFSFGDDIASGKILANRLRYRLGGPLQKFLDDGKLAIGICNGFQVMAKMGMLPYFDGQFAQEVTLTHNDSSRFEDRWVTLAAAASPCVWTRGVELLEVPVRHGEGKFVVRDAEVLARLEQNRQIVLRYVQRDGAPASGAFPANPNGSVDDIAGICDPSGRILGLMPHPEAHVHRTNHPRWTRETLPAEGAGLRIFHNAVSYAAATV
ncbi:MAG: phosphoribosylformylglycinamidine synthase subunit PurQ [Candidatus Hydrogenedentes bacterium]|nr:phosphoribosylformylglycinamidine synthase subunit PurQ [Candidatus Hydrogenedentota bacterium]